MARPYSNDSRERVVCTVESGEACRAVGKRFGVAVSCVVKRRQRYRRTGSVAPGKMGEHRKIVLEPYGDFIIARIEETPHLTLHGLNTHCPDDTVVYQELGGAGSSNNDRSTS